MTPSILVILLHSPLVGPATWSLLLPALEARQIEAIAPALATVPGQTPYWRQHVDAVRQAIQRQPADRPLVLVAHSGAGVLLPVLREALGGRPVRGYVLVDAIVPQHLKSRLDLFDSPESAASFRNAAKDGFLPVWTDDRLRTAIPDSAVRRRFVSELRPLPLAVYEEPIPVFRGWPDAPCAYLRFTAAYEADEARAKGAGCMVEHSPGGHFRMLTAPADVADEIVVLVESLANRRP
jgi:hypothetical protein